MNNKRYTSSRAVTTTSSCKPLFPFLDLRAQYATIKDDILAAMHRVMESQSFILGPEVETLERAVADLIGCHFAVSCASGSDALLLVLMALGIGTGDEVITTPFTFSATAGSIFRLGAQPVFVDIDHSTYNLDPARLERAITRKTRAIMPIHLFGLAADMHAIRSLAQEHGLPVIEDAAQAMGALYRGSYVGTLGTAGCFSFFPSKNLGGAGDGGIITTDDAELAEKVRLLRVHGTREKYNCEFVGINSRLDALQAAILSVKLRHLHDWTAARRDNAERYRIMFQESGLATLVELPAAPPDSLHVYNQFVIRSQERDALRQHLRESGIPSEIYYPYPLHLQRAFAGLGYKESAFPESELACKQVLALPVFPELTESQQRKVVEAVLDFYS